MPLRYVTGDATTLLEPGRPTVIAHCCNDGVPVPNTDRRDPRWGAGFVLAVSSRWPHVRQAYLDWGRGRCPFDGPFELGAVQFVEAEPNVTIANVIGQHNIRWQAGLPPIRYDAIRTGMERVAAFASQRLALIQMPRIGGKMAGGDWRKIEPILLETMDRVDAVVFDFTDTSAPSYVGTRSRQR